MEMKEAIDKIWNETKYQGKFIRRKAWGKNYYLKLDIDVVVDYDGERPIINAIDLFEDDWEIIDEI